mgnify:CR=1 FL=1
MNLNIREEERTEDDNVLSRVDNRQCLGQHLAISTSCGRSPVASGGWPGTDSW